MRRAIVLSSVLAASVAVISACQTPASNNATVTKPSPAITPVSSPVATPVASPTASPVASPVKPGTTPEVKKTDEKPVNKDAKPASTATPKA